jgi:hypothetical protein
VDSAFLPPRGEIFSGRFALEVQLANAASVRKAGDALAAIEAVTRDGAPWRVADPLVARAAL